MESRCVESTAPGRGSQGGRASVKDGHKTGSMRNTHQRGIAIGPILFVVAILAVLASAIAAGSGAFNGDISAISAKAQASAILEYANEVKFAVDRVLAKGCKDTEISFENSIISGYVNPNAPSDKSCHVFDVNGGGIVWKKPPANTSGYAEGLFYSGHHGFVGTSLPLGGINPTQDLILFFPNITKDVCEEINMLILSNSSIPSFSTLGFNTDAKFIGTYWFGYTRVHNLPFSECVKADAYYGPWASYTIETGQYHFYKVLIAH